MNDRNDLMMIDAIERYICGEMSPDERLHFENMRKANSELDQMVVEHTLFLQQMNRFGEWKKFKSSLDFVHTSLEEQGKIHTENSQGKSKVIYLWNRYKKVAGIAASIAGITAITLSFLFNSVTPTAKDHKVQELVKEVNTLKHNQRVLDKKIQSVDKGSQETSIAMDVRFNGTGFLINNKGLMITNAHVVKNSRNIYVQNNKGEQFKAFVVKLDVPRDVAIIRIDDSNFKPFTLPYSIRKTTSELAEPIFTLGFPREQIVYGEGYLSASTGYNGDTLSCQITIPANPGNSGGPIFNHNGEVIGILSSKEIKAEGAVFAVQSKYIYQAIDELKNSPEYQNVKLSSKTSLAGVDKSTQVKKIKDDCIFMVKGD